MGLDGEIPIDGATKAGVAIADGAGRLLEGARELLGKLTPNNKHAPQYTEYPYKFVKHVGQGRTGAEIIDVKGEARIFKEGCNAGSAHSAMFAKALGVKFGLGEHFAEIELCRFKNVGRHHTTRQGTLQEIVDGRTYFDLGKSIKDIPGFVRVFDYIAGNADRILNEESGLNNLMVSSEGKVMLIDNDRCLYANDLTPRTWCADAKAENFREVFQDSDGSISDKTREVMEMIMQMTEGELRELLQANFALDRKVIHHCVRRRKDLVIEYKALQGG